MLSIVDLIEAETFAPDLAAYALAAISRGASFLVGALPGGAGKTTVMGALLNFVPADIELAPADGLATIRSGAAAPHPRRCYICHEIGRGSYYAYLWGEALRAYFDLPAAGHMIATNLHADTFEQAREQIRADNGVAESAFGRMNLMFFLSVTRRGFGTRRRIEAVWESDGTGPHRQVYSAGSPGAVESSLVAPDDVAAARKRLDRLLADGARTIEQVRSALYADGPAEGRP